MDLYTSLQNYVGVTDLINDVSLEYYGYITWDELVESNRLQPEADTDLQTAVAYWRGLYDSETEQSEKEIISLRMERALNNAFRGAERGQITLDQFNEIIGTA